MLIADSQVHVWAANTPERPWAPGTRPHRAEPLRHEELLREMDAAGVDRVVIVPPSLDGARNDLALAAAQAYPDRFAVIGKIDVKDLQARERLARWRSQPGMLGLRFNFKRTPQTLASGDADWVWGVAGGSRRADLHRRVAPGRSGDRRHCRARSRVADHI